MINNRFKSLLRVSKDKADCLKAIRLITEQRSKLPFELSNSFESAFGIDKCLPSFLKAEFDLNLDANADAESIIAELIAGNMSDNNPVSKLKDGDLIADQIYAYSSISSQIRAAFNIPLAIPLSENELLPCDSVSLNIETLYCPVFDENGNQMQNTHIQIDMQSPILSIDSKNEVFTNTFTTDINDIRITYFVDNVALGAISATTVSCDKSTIMYKGMSLECPKRLRNSVILHESEMYSQKLSKVITSIGDVAEDLAIKNNQSTHNAIASQFMLPEPTTGRFAILVIKHVDLDTSVKCQLFNIFESVRYAFEDPAAFNLETYSRLTPSYNPVVWDVSREHEDIKRSYNIVKKRICLSGISVISALPEDSWWYTMLTHYNPCIDGFETETRVIAKSYMESIVSAKHNNDYISSAFDEMLMYAVEDRKEVKFN